MKCRLFSIALLLAVSIAGCATQPQQPYVVTPQIDDPQPQISSTNPQAGGTNASIGDAHPTASVRTLPYKGRLVEGDPTELPPAVANALAKDAPLTFTYREELTHDEYHIPTIVTAFDPVTYLGAPLGDYAVTASATLTISEGNRTIADYTAKARVSQSWNVYSQPKHSELERAARDAVRKRIEQKLYADADRVAHSAAAPPPALPE
jgi:hypothetical protein